MNYGHTEPMEQREQCELAQTLPSCERGRRSQITEITERLFMDDSHRDDCLILVENKGFMLVEES